MIIYYELSQVHYYATRVSDQAQCMGTWKCPHICAHMSCGLMSTVQCVCTHLTVVQDRNRKGKNDSRTLVGKQNKLDEWETTCIVAEWR